MTNRNYSLKKSSVRHMSLNNYNKQLNFREKLLNKVKKCIFLQHPVLCIYESVRM